MADTANIYGRKSWVDDAIAGIGTGVSKGLAAVPKAVSGAVRGIGSAFSNTIGNNGPGGSGAPTYVADPYGLDNAGVQPAATVTPIAAVAQPAATAAPIGTPSGDAGYVAAPARRTAAAITTGLPSATLKKRPIGDIVAGIGQPAVDAAAPTTTGPVPMIGDNAAIAGKQFDSAGADITGKPGEYRYGADGTNGGFGLTRNADGTVDQMVTLRPRTIMEEKIADADLARYNAEHPFGTAGVPQPIDTSPGSQAAWEEQQRNLPDGQPAFFKRRAAALADRTQNEVAANNLRVAAINQQNADTQTRHFGTADTIAVAKAPGEIQHIGAQTNQAQATADKTKLEMTPDFIAADLAKKKGEATYFYSHANAADAMAGYHRAISDPNYLLRQERIAGIRDDAARQKEQDKLDGTILTSGFGVAPTPQALNGYRSWQNNLQAWDRQITPFVASLDKSHGPEDAGKIKSALIAYSQDPTSKTAIKQVGDARSILTGGGKGTVPDWFNKALSMPRFETKGLQPWKQPAIPSIGE